MSTWPQRERPRERLRELGPSALSDSELLAVLLGTGSQRENAVEVGRRILSASGGIEQIARQGLGSLASIDGVGEAKAARLIAALELGVRAFEQAGRKAAWQSRFSCSADIHGAYKARLSVLQQEVFLVVGLNNKNEVKRELIVAKGSVNECRVEPREVFRPMIAEAAARLILIHNHPSGDPEPSPDDVRLTKRLSSIGELIGIPILDHIVIGRRSYSSMRDLGILDAPSV